MKNIFIVSLLLIFLVSCSNEPPKYKIVKTGTETSQLNWMGNISIIGETNIQGCEYFVVHTYGYNIPIHKGNCKNPIHHHYFDSLKYIQKIEKDSIKIKFLETKIRLLEKTKNLK